MGEMADDFLDQVMDAENDRLDYILGHIPQQEAIDRGILDEHGAIPSPKGAPSKTCKYCGTSGLQWKQVGGKWKLHNGSMLHTCPF